MATVVYNLESSQPTGCVSSRKGCPPAFRCPPNRELSTDWRCPVNRGSAVMKQKNGGCFPGDVTVCTLWSIQMP